MNKKTIKDLMKMKKEAKRVSMITAYDYYMSKLVDEAGIDVILVGDSLGMVVQGRETTLPVTVNDMIYHTQAVCRGAKNALIVADLPFMSYQVGVEKAVENAGKIMKESGAGAVKIEGGSSVLPQIKAIIKAGIPVMGHLGLTPQSVNQFGGFKVQGKNSKNANKIIDDAFLLQEAGVFSIVLETVPLELAKIITDKIDIPTIGIGAGPYCDGQVLVLQDLLGIDQGFKPKFVRRYANIQHIIDQAVSNYIKDVKNNNFPEDKESFHMDKNSLKDLKGGAVK